MGLVDGLFGNASAVDIKKLEGELSPILVRGEEIKLGFKVIRDMIVFTNARLLLIDKQGITGKKIEYHTIPYKSITHFALETAGHFDMDSELKIWVSGCGEPIVKTLSADSDIATIQKTLAACVLVNRPAAGW